MVTQRDFFMVSQTNGTVILKSLTTFEIIGSLNDPTWNPKLSANLNMPFEVISGQGVSSGSQTTRATISQW